VRHMGLNYSNMWGRTGFGYDFAHSLDVGLVYKVPYYSER
jgi:hypothetical protein